MRMSLVIIDRLVTMENLGGIHLVMTLATMIARLSVLCGQRLQTCSCPVVESESCHEGGGWAIGGERLPDKKTCCTPESFFPQDRALFNEGYGRAGFRTHMRRMMSAGEMRRGTIPSCECN